MEFLSDDQVAAYQRFVGDLSRSELEGFFLLDASALDLIAHKRGAYNRLGFGLQIGTVRYLGQFLTEDPLDVTWSAVEYVAGQLDIADPSVVKRYTERQQTAYEHAWEIRAAYGYRPFEAPGVHEALLAFMSARARIHAEGAVALFEQAGQEDQLGALGLVLNAVVLFNTRYIDLAVNVLRGQGYPVRDEDAARLSPLGYAHINMLGRYTFPVRRPSSGYARFATPKRPLVRADIELLGVRSADRSDWPVE